MKHRLQFLNGVSRRDFNSEDTTLQGLHFQFVEHGGHGVQKTFNKKSFKLCLKT